MIDCLSRKCPIAENSTANAKIKKIKIQPIINKKLRGKENWTLAKKTQIIIVFIFGLSFDKKTVN